MARVLVAMSGGVDSSVAAWLLQRQGHECMGVTMQLYDNPMVGLDRGHTCCSLDDVEDARSVARRLGMPHYVFNFKEAFERYVIRDFTESYLAGRTPNPCIRCNRFLKFDLLLHRARELGCDYIATGHYAIREQAGERFLLRKAVDVGKDQSYVLYAMTGDQFAHTLLPLGGLHKAEVRAIAEREGFINARKRDSQDICFVPDGDYAAFLERYTGRALEPGDLLDLGGNVIGRHRGAAAYTIGQRRGLGFAAGDRVYVCAKDMEKNTVTLGPEEALYTDTVLAEDWNWIVPPPTEPIPARVKLRYRQVEQPAVLERLSDGRVQMRFAAPQRAVSPGQAAVAYDGDTVLGGGTILE
jgi:tRNA-specific 2-thiouridylase